MTKRAAPFAALLLAACATPQPTQEVEAGRDYVAASELESVRHIRTDERWSYSQLNDRFVIVTALRKKYLVEFVRNCSELNYPLEPHMIAMGADVVDQRSDSRTLRASTDTIRGCRIEAFYPVTRDQVQELKNLGDAPGEEVFLPDEDE